MQWDEPGGGRHRRNRPGIAVIARNRKSKGVTTKDTKEIAKIAGLPPQQAKVGLAGGPGIAKIG